MKEIRENNGIGSSKEVGSPLLDWVVREGLSEEVIMKLGPNMKQRVSHMRYGTGHFNQSKLQGWKGSQTYLRRARRPLWLRFSERGSERNKCLWLDILFFLQGSSEALSVYGANLNLRVFICLFISCLGWLSLSLYPRWQGVPPCL